MSEMCFNGATTGAEERRWGNLIQLLRGSGGPHASQILLNLSLHEVGLWTLFEPYPRMLGTTATARPAPWQINISGRRDSPGTLQISFRF